MVSFTPALSAADWDVIGTPDKYGLNLWGSDIQVGTKKNLQKSLDVRKKFVTLWAENIIY